jgi:hypothetical protein
VSLREIEIAVEDLPRNEKEELLVFLAAQLRAERQTPEPRKFSQEQIATWIAQDEEDMRRFRQSK